MLQDQRFRNSVSLYSVELAAPLRPDRSDFRRADRRRRANVESELPVTGSIDLSCLWSEMVSSFQARGIVRARDGAALTRWQTKSATNALSINEERLNHETLPEYSCGC